MMLPNGTKPALQLFMLIKPGDILKLIDANDYFFPFSPGDDLRHVKYGIYIIFNKIDIKLQGWFSCARVNGYPGSL